MQSAITRTSLCASVPAYLSLIWRLLTWQPFKQFKRTICITSACIMKCMHACQAHVCYHMRPLFASVLVSLSYKSDPMLVLLLSTT